MRESSQPGVRPTKEQIALLMAMWAVYKPDSLHQRYDLLRRTEQYRINFQEKKSAEMEQEKEGEKVDEKIEADNIIPDEDTGATLLDSNNMIMSVAGSGATHAAAYLCNRFPQQAYKGTICLSKRPCSFCVKLMIQRGVRRIIVPEVQGSYLEPLTGDSDKGSVCLRVWCYDNFGKPLSTKACSGIRVKMGKKGADHLQELAPGEGSIQGNHFTLKQKLEEPGEYTARLIQKGRTVHTVEWAVEAKTLNVKWPNSNTPSRKPISVYEAEQQFFEQESCKPCLSAKQESPTKADMPAQRPIKERMAFIDKLLHLGNASFSVQDLPQFAHDIFNKLRDIYCRSYAVIKENQVDEQGKSKEQSAEAWLLGLCIIASLRSEDQDAKVGAVLARTIVTRGDAVAASGSAAPSDCSDTNKRPPKHKFSIDVFGVGYNGAKKDALPRDFVQGDDDKGKWALHAEQNLFMFRCIDDASVCELYTTHSPCIQCSGIVRAMGVEKVSYIKPYRPPLIDLQSDDVAKQFVERKLLDVVEVIHKSHRPACESAKPNRHSGDKSRPASASDETQDTPYTPKTRPPRGDLTRPKGNKGGQQLFPESPAS